jgi:hypothetical protein
MKKKEYKYEFIDKSENSSISFEYDDDIEETFRVEIENSVPVIYANKTALKLLGDTFIKMYLSNYKPGFHIHLNEDFDADLKESLRVILIEDE